MVCHTYLHVRYGVSYILTRTVWCVICTYTCCMVCHTYLHVLYGVSYVHTRTVWCVICPGHVWYGVLYVLVTYGMVWHVYWSRMGWCVICTGHVWDGVACVLVTYGMVWHVYWSRMIWCVICTGHVWYGVSYVHVLPRIVWCVMILLPYVLIRIVLWCVLRYKSRNQCSLSIVQFTMIQVDPTSTPNPTGHGRPWSIPASVPQAFNEQHSIMFIISLHLCPTRMSGVVPSTAGASTRLVRLHEWRHQGGRQPSSTLWRQLFLSQRIPRLWWQPQRL